MKKIILAISLLSSVGVYAQSSIEIIEQRLAREQRQGHIEVKVENNINVNVQTETENEYEYLYEENYVPKVYEYQEQNTYYYEEPVESRVSKKNIEYMSKMVKRSKW